MEAPPNLIDIHNHFFPSCLVRYLAAREEFPRIMESPTGRVIEYAPETYAPFKEEMGNLDLKLGAMDAASISTAVISVATARLDVLPKREARALIRDVNDELAAIVGERPDRFTAFASVPIQDPDYAIEELERAVGKEMKGAILESNVAGRYLDDPSFYPVFAAAAELDTAVFLHPNYPVVAGAVDEYGLLPVFGFLIDTSIATLRLIFSGLFELHPDMKLILAHTGSLLPYIAGRLDTFFRMGRLPTGAANGALPPSEYLRQLYTDTVCVWPPALRMADEFFGPERIMFGSDSPYFTPNDCYAAVVQAGLPGPTMRGIEFGNATGVLEIDVRR